MAIPDAYRHNFDTLGRATLVGDLVLMACYDSITGEPRFVICAPGREEGEWVLAPFGHLCDSNPYEAYSPIGPEGGTVS